MFENMIARPNVESSLPVRLITLTMMVCLPSAIVFAQHWPQFRGPNRDGKSLETGLMKQWPDDGPKLLRTISGFGSGFSTPVIAGERIYISGKVGDDLKLFCFELSGNRIWERTHGLAFRESGEITARAEYGSPILIEFDGVRQVVTMSRAGLVAVSPEDGKFLWQHNRMARIAMAESNTAHGNSAAYADGYVFEATSYQTRGGSAVRLKSNGVGLTSEVAWESDKLNCEHGGYVVVDGFVYMNQGVGWSCLELKTGEERWFGRGPGKGSIIYADGMLYCLGEKGTVAFIEAKPAGFNMVSKFDLPAGEGPCWTHPVICDQNLFLRWGDKLFVYDIANRAEL